MVETRRSSSSSQFLPPQNDKPLKTADAAAAEGSDGSGADKEQVVESGNGVSEKMHAAATPEKLPDVDKVKDLTTPNIGKERPAKGNAETEWGKLLSQCSRNPHVLLTRKVFTVGQGRECDLCLGDPSVSNYLCTLKHIKFKRGASTTLLGITGKKGNAQVNNKVYPKNSIVLLRPGDEVVFGSSGEHAYVLNRAEIECSDLEMLCIKDQALTIENVEKIIGWALSHHFINNSDNSDKESKLLISSESIKYGIGILQGIQNKPKSLKKSLKEKALALAENRPLPSLHSIADVRPLSMEDFKHAHEQVGASVASQSAALIELLQWNELYGEGGSRKKECFSYYM